MESDTGFVYCIGLYNIHSIAKTKYCDNRSVIFGNG